MTKHKRNRNGLSFYTKNLFQILLWLIEVVVIPMLFVFFSTKIAPFQPEATLFDYLERYLTLYALYQISVFVILNSINDSKKDQTLAIVTAYEYLLLYQDTKDEEVKNLILRRCDAQLDTSVMNNSELRSEYANIRDLLVSQSDNLTIVYVNLRLIYFKHIYEEISLSWKYSLIVWLFKV